MSQKRLTEQSLLVEVGWEVCSQLGGIYTVLKTKAQAMVSDDALRLSPCTHSPGA